MTTLVFPSVTPHGQQYVENARMRGEDVIAAASIQSNAGTSQGETQAAFLQLPSIHDADFEARFLALIQSKAIDHIYSPVTLVYVRLRELIASHNLPVRFVDLPPFYAEIERQWREAGEQQARHRWAAQLLGNSTFPAPVAFHAIMRGAFAIFGESYHDKLAAFIAAICDAPAGDFIEIGALFGRSSSVIVQTLNLTGRDNAVLAVDAWKGANAHQQSLPDTLAQAALEVDWDAIADSFDINLLPLARSGRFNRLRLPSQAAFAIYQRDHRVSSEPFGITDYEGAISFLHIDANHDYDAVKQDCALWTSRMKPGGWIIFDDYAWRHGSGPGKVADEFCTARQIDIARAFFIDGALFVKLSD